MQNSEKYTSYSLETMKIDGGVVYRPAPGHLPLLTPVSDCVYRFDYANEVNVTVLTTSIKWQEDK